MNRWTLGFLITGALVVIGIALAVHFRYSTITASTGAGFFLVDRWTGRTWFVLGATRREVVDQPSADKH
jgi:hypothetical protein